MNNMSKVGKHFDQIADDYDAWKRKNNYYYQSVKNLYREFIGEKKSVLDIGCGTGDILTYLNPSYGVGIDISTELVSLAQEKHKKIKKVKFSNLPVLNFRKDKFDFIIMSDVIEHLENVNAMFADVSKVARKDTHLLITMANPSWEPILEIAEKFKLKMPEGPHYRLSDKRLVSILKKNQFKVIHSGSRLVFPIGLGFISDFINSNYWKFAVLKNLGVIHYFLIKKV